MYLALSGIVIRTMIEGKDELFFFHLPVWPSKEPPLSTLAAPR